MPRRWRVARGGLVSPQAGDARASPPRLGILLIEVAGVCACSSPRSSSAMRRSAFGWSLLLATAAAFVPASHRRAVVAPRFVGGGEEDYLCDESVERVLADARVDLSALFGYEEENRQVGITGTVDFVGIEGPSVVVRLGGRFWHQRSDVLQRVGSYLQDRIPEICDVEIEDPAQLDDADKIKERGSGW